MRSCKWFSIQTPPSVVRCPSGEHFRPTTLHHIHQRLAFPSTSLHFTYFCHPMCKVVSENDHQLLQNDLDSLNSWSHKWNLPFNETKFRLLHFSSKANCDSCPYTINGHCITPSNLMAFCLPIHSTGRTLQPNNLKGLQTTQFATEDFYYT